MKRKTIAALLSVAMLASLMTGCGGSGSSAEASQASGASETEESTSEEASGEESTSEAGEASAAVNDGEDPQLEKSIKILAIWDSGSDSGELITKLCDQYIAEVNPNFSYEYEYVSSDDMKTKVSTYLASNDLPDIFTWESGAPLKEYVDEGLVADITEIATEYGCYDSLDPAAVSLLETLGGTEDLYDLPLGMNVEGFWYNKEAFETAGIESAPETWEEFEEACQKLQDAGIQPIAAGGSDKWGVTRVINAYLVRTAGADVLQKAADGELQYTDDVFVEAAAKIQEWAEKGWFGEGVNTVDMTTAGTMLMNGQAGMFYNGSWFAENLNDESSNAAGEDGIGFFNVPVYDESISDINSYSMNCGTILCVSSAKYDEATGWFLKYFIENMGNIAMETQGTVKGYTYTASTDSLASYTQVVLDELDKAESAFTWFEASMSSEVSAVAQDQVQSLMTSDITPEEYMQLIQDAHDMSN